MNLPVIAPNDASRREVIGNGGIFTDVNNPESYFLDIEKALKIDWHNKPRIQAEKFSWETHLRTLDTLFHSVSAHPRHKS